MGRSSTTTNTSSSLACAWSRSLSFLESDSPVQSYLGELKTTISTHKWSLSLPGSHGVPNDFIKFQFLPHFSSVSSDQFFNFLFFFTTQRWSSAELILCTLLQSGFYSSRYRVRRCAIQRRTALYNPNNSIIIVISFFIF